MLDSKHITAPSSSSSSSLSSNHHHRYYRLSSFVVVARGFLMVLRAAEKKMQLVYYRKLKLQADILYLQLYMQHDSILLYFDSIFRIRTLVCNL
mmetsp:Transcript_11585/g.19087  ORF Transcript_11585/g.19087 Transcript_11585/m.19087 type:complete len:94 (-) Transcript_11585:162-443(-)